MSARILLSVSTCTVMLSLFFPPSASGQSQSDAPPNTVLPVLVPTPQFDASPDAIAAPLQQPPSGPPPELSLNDEPAASRSPFDMGGFGSSMGRDFRPSVDRADYRVTWFPSEPVSGQNTNLGFVREDFTAIVPTWHDDRNDFAATVHIRNELFQTNAVLTNPPQRFPEELWDVRFGGSYRHLFDNGWIAGGSVGLGSSGDKPFDAERDFTANISAFLVVPQGERNYWLFNIVYSSNSDLPFPIPGVAFVWQPTDNFRLHIGLPFEMMYRPIDNLQFDVSYFIPYTFRARLTYRITPWLRVYAGYEAGDEAYPLFDRADSDDRLFYYEQHVVSGLQFKLNSHISLDASGGYVFDRYYFEGQNRSDSSSNRLDVGDGAFLSLQFLARW